MIPLYDENYHDTTIWGCYIIMIVCTFLMALQTIMNMQGVANFQDSFAMIPAQFFGQAQGITKFPEWITLFTSAYMHADGLHLLGNMFFLWLFADNIEHAFGHFRFVVFYILSCAITAYGYALLHPYSTIPLVGASGAISAAMGAYLVLYPRAKVTIYINWWMPDVEVDAFLIMIYWLLLDIVGFASLTGEETGGVAYEAHIIGFAIGILLGRVLRQNMSSYDEIWAGLGRIKHSVPHTRWENMVYHAEERKKFR